MISTNNKSVRDEYGSYTENWFIVSKNSKAWGLTMKDIDRLIEKHPDSNDIWLEDVRWIHALRLGNDERYSEEVVEARQKAIISSHNKDVDLRISWKKAQIDMIAEKLGRDTQ